MLWEKRMLLSTLSFSHGLEILNEKEFDVLALVAQNPEKKCLTFVNEQRYFSRLSKTVSMVITKPELKDSVPALCGVLVSENPALTFFKLHNFLENNSDYVRAKYKTVIGGDCKISNLASVAEHNVTVGNNVVIEDFVTVYPNTIIKDNAVIRSGAKIGGQGFEYKRCSGNAILAVNHYGGVVIEQNAVIHCNTCVDRAVYPWDNTVVGEYTAVDNLCHIGHGVKLGKRLLVAAGTVIGGRTEIGDDSWIGMGVTVKNAIVAGENVSINMGSVLADSLKSNKAVSGNYAVEQDAFFYHQLKMMAKK